MHAAWISIIKPRPSDGSRSSPSWGRSCLRIIGKHLRDGVWELRIIIQHHQHRFLYSFWKDIIVVTNAFLKKSREVPPARIEQSRKAMADWIARREWESIYAKSEKKRKRSS